MSNPAGLSKRLSLTIAILLFLGVVAGAGALTQNGPPPPDATPGYEGVTELELGAVEEPVAAPGHRLRMIEVVFAPGSFVTRHAHPGATVVCVASGSWGIIVHEGAVTLSRAGTAATPAPAETVEFGAENILDAGDCIAMDESSGRTIHTVWNPGDTETVLWIIDLYRPDETFTQFIDEMGTPLP